MHIHVSILLQTPLLSRVPHNTEQSSLCYTVGPCWLSILSTAMCTCVHVHPKLPNYPFPSSFRHHDYNSTYINFSLEQFFSQLCVVQTCQFHIRVGN